MAEISNKVRVHRCEMVSSPTSFIFIRWCLGELTLTITQLINNVEVPFNSSQVNAYLGENLTFRCYINFTLGNNTYLDKNVVWDSLQFQKRDNKEDDNSMLKLTDVQILDRGVYKCIDYKHLLFKSFLLVVSLPKNPINMFDFFTPRKFDPIVLDNTLKTIPNSDEFVREMPDLTNYKVPKITYNRFFRSRHRTAQWIILGIMAGSLIIAGVMVLCGYIKLRTLPVRSTTSPNQN